MLNFKKVILHNFGSYGHAEIELANKGMCLVSGKNNYKKDRKMTNSFYGFFIYESRNCKRTKKT